MDCYRRVFDRPLQKQIWNNSSVNVNWLLANWLLANWLVNWPNEELVLTGQVYSASQKIPPPWGFLTFFPMWLGIFSPNFTYLLYVLPMLEYQFLSNYLQFWQSYAILNAINQHAFQPMVDILSIWWWSHLIWHNFIKVVGKWIKICSPT